MPAEPVTPRTSETAASATPGSAPESSATPASAAPSSATPRKDAALLALSGVEAVPGSKKPDPILVADGVTRRFGGLLAVEVDHIEIQRGSITALIGPNGAGKSTFFNLLTGFDTPSEGTWTFNGQSLAGVA